jgi:hypothetical protein
MALHTNINACTQCGAQEIKTHDCGYSSFNPGTATCIKCGRKIEVSCCDTGNPDKSLIAQWNKDNPDPQVIMDSIDRKIDKLKKEKKRLKKLFKI